MKVQVTVASISLDGAGSVSAAGVDVFAESDGRLAFRVPVDRLEKAKFFRVTVGDSFR